MKKFFANSFLNLLFFFILLVAVFVYLEISWNIILNLWVRSGVVVLVLIFADHIKKRCRESLEEDKD